MDKLGLQTIVIWGQFSSSTEYESAQVRLSGLVENFPPNSRSTDAYLVFRSCADRRTRLAGACGEMHASILLENCHIRPARAVSLLTCVWRC